MASSSSKDNEGRFGVGVGATAGSGSAREHTDTAPAGSSSAPATSQERCPICLDPLVSSNTDDYGDSSNLTELGFLDCSHFFHVGCIELWVATTSSTCPLDRKEVALIRVKESINGKVIRTIKVAKKKQRHADQGNLVGADDEDDEGGVPSQYDLTECRICGRTTDEQVMLLCDGCEDGYHTYCLHLEHIPEGDWFCPKCEDIRNTSRQLEEERRRRRRGPPMVDTASLAEAATEVAAESARPRTTRTLASAAGVAIRGASASQIRLLRIQARLSRRGARGGPNRRWLSLRDLDDDDDDSDDLSSLGGSDEDDDDEEGESDFAGDDNADGNEEATRTSPRLYALPPPRPGRRDITMPDTRPASERGGRYKGWVKPKGKKKARTDLGPLPDNRFERPVGEKLDKGKRKRTSRPRRQDSSDRPSFKPGDEERFLWKQLQLAQMALEGPRAPVASTRVASSSSSLSMSSAARKGKGKVVAMPAIDGQPPEKWRMSASRHYSPATSVVPSFSRNHDESFSSTANDGQSGGQVDILEQLLGKFDEAEERSMPFLAKLRPSGATSGGSDPAPPKEANGVTTSQSPSLATVQTDKPSSPTNHTHRNLKTIIFEKHVRPQLEPLYASRKLTRQEFSEIGRTATRTLFEACGGKYEPEAMAIEARKLVEELLTKEGISM